MRSVPFCKQGNQNTERFNLLPRVAKLSKGGARIINTGSLARVYTDIALYITRVQTDYNMVYFNFGALSPVSSCNSFKNYFFGGVFNVTRIYYPTCFNMLTESTS